MAGLQVKREEILRRVREVAEKSGAAPGMTMFAATTGIKPHVWRGLWRTWNDVLCEAGLPPNMMAEAYDDEQLIARFLDLAVRLGRFPTSSDLRFERKNSEDFPSHRAFEKRWPMLELAKIVVSRCSETENSRLAELAADYIDSRKLIAPEDDEATDAEAANAAALGYVYLQKHGSDYKIGRTKSLNRRGREIQLELPREVELIHSILTDDPSGVEAYWHARFAIKRTRGEWFKLTKGDVAAFRRWAKIW